MSVREKQTAKLIPRRFFNGYMEIIYQKENQYLLRIQRGDELVEEVLRFCEKEGIRAAWVEGLGAGDKVEISYYDFEKREYVPAVFEEEFELLNLTGNIALIDDKPFLHAHVTLGRKDMSTLGGHLHSMRVSGTG